MANKIISINKLGGTWATLDPFLFCVHHLDNFPKGNENLGPQADLRIRNIGQDFSGQDGWSMYHGQKVPGFPYHPHRGFETITVVEKGLADHSDSLGATGRFGGGDVQWMTAGKGVQHSEMFPLVNQNEPNPLELFQIWLNLPKKSKMVEPNYKMLWSEDIPEVHEQDASGKQTTIKIIAGRLKNTEAIAPPPNSWAADKDNYLAIWLVTMEAGAEWKVPKSAAGLNRAIYFYSGKNLEVEAQSIAAYHSVQIISDEAVTIKAGDEDSKFLLLQAKPINEPVAQHGPFVMNTQAEIIEAFNEYRKTEFGGWPWPETEFVHPRNQSRFAKYPNGSIEEKG